MSSKSNTGSAYFNVNVITRDEKLEYFGQRGSENNNFIDFSHPFHEVVNERTLCDINLMHSALDFDRHYKIASIHRFEGTVNEGFWNEMWLGRNECNNRPNPTPNTSSLSTQARWVAAEHHRDRAL